MVTAANILALTLLIVAGYLLTVRTWHQKRTIEDFIGGFEGQIAGLIDAFASDKETHQTADQRMDALSKRVFILAGIVANKIKQDHRSARDDITRAKTGIFLLVCATIIQVYIVVFG